jgi:predicted metal-dependent hydrolase
MDSTGRGDDYVHVPVVCRRMKFDLDADVPRYWHSESAWITHFMSALSVLFPEGERFFIDSVRHYEREIDDPALEREVRAFIKQEAHHSHHHQAYNDRVTAQGLGLDRWDAFVGRILRFVRRVAPPKVQLAATIGLEHFTAVLANQLLTNEKLTRGMHPAVRPLWIWHAIEETEHKAVAFDVYQQVGGGYWTRVLMMARMMIGFPLILHIIQLSLVRRDRRLTDWRDALRFARFAWGRDGFLRAIWPELRAWYHRDFHPWQMDNRELIEAWRGEYGPHVVGI